ncbi:MAG: hypothetical protein ABIJ34_08240 [archaeon]
MRNFGKLIILKDLEHPFFSFDKNYFFSIKGIIGESEFKVIFRRNNMDKTSKLMYVIMKNYKKADSIIHTKKYADQIMKQIKR